MNFALGIIRTKPKLDRLSRADDVYILLKKDIAKFRLVSGC